MRVDDVAGRPLRSLRLSVTDRCNLRCQYCMPEADYVWLPRQDLLSFEELGRVVDAFIAVGVDKVRLTGGEPLLRRDLPALVALLAERQIPDLSVTTNGLLLASQAQALRDAGLHRVTVSLDTLKAERFQLLTRSREHAAVLNGIHTAAAIFGGLKIDTVVLKGVNDDELVELVELGRRVNAEVRFIEYMDVGGATRWTRDQVVTRAEMLARLTAAFGPVLPLPRRSSAPADRYRLPDDTLFGIIASTSAPFCADCDRVRLTADGMCYTCLYATTGTDLRGPLRAGADDRELQLMITGMWRQRADRGAEDRLAAAGRGAFIPVTELRRDSHLEMHTKGG